MKHGLRYLLILLLPFLLFVGGCSDDGDDGAATETSGPVSVAISPSSANVDANGTKTFTAIVSGTSNTQVTWSVAEVGGGSINSSGIYTAPLTVGTYHVKVTSVADLSKSATATVTVTAGTQPFPLGTWVGPNGVSFTVSRLVTSGANFLDWYSGSVTYSGGTITVSGTADDSNMIISGHDSIINGNGELYFSVWTSGGTKLIDFQDYYIKGVGDQNPSQKTGSLSIFSYSNPSATDNYLNLNAIFIKQ